MNRYNYSSGKTKNNIAFSKKYTKKYTEEIDEIMNEFDFARVHSIMLHLKWVWTSGGKRRIPSISELRKTARSLLENLASHENTESSQTGGFNAFWDQDEEGWALSLDFVVASSQVWTDRETKEVVSLPKEKA